MMLVSQAFINIQTELKVLKSSSTFPTAELHVWYTDVPAH